MAVKTIPQSYEHKCDGCGKTEHSSSSSRLSHWSVLAISRDAHDYSGAAVADGSITRLLCETCGSVVAEAVSEAIRARAALSGDRP